MQAINTTIAVIMAGLLVVPTLGRSEVGQPPDTPETAAYVSQINRDWVIVSVNTGVLFRFNLEEFEEKINETTEIYDVGEFACRLYDRTSVLLSQSYQGSKEIVTRIDYLFACAIP